MLQLRLGHIEVVRLLNATIKQREKEKEEARKQEEARMLEETRM